jgi:CheY-like chemotaxis protein
MEIHERALLLIEDDADDIELTMRTFKKNKLANGIVVARDGAEALDYLDRVRANADTKPSLIILDLRLPKVDGLEVFRRIRQDESTKTIPVVVLTTSDEEEDRVKSYESGANCYVRKPVDFTKFAEVVRGLGFFWLVTNEQPPKQKI